MHQLQPVIARTLEYIAGHRVDFYFVPETYTKEVAGNPLEEHLQEYASTSLTTDLPQFDAEPTIAPSHKHRAYLEPLLLPAGIVPTHPIGLPANIPSELLNTLLTEGDDSMTNPSDPTRVRIHSHVNQSQFLHVEDALGIGGGKLRLFGGTYRRKQGMTAHSVHFLDLDDARVIFDALVRGEQGFSYKEYKGTPAQTRHLDRLGASSEQGRRNGNGAISRVLSIAVKGENVYIELKTGPGKLTNTGAITPNGKPEVEVNVGFKLYEARRMAASVLAYIQAWDVMRMMVNQQLVSRSAPYLLVPATSEVHGNRVASPVYGSQEPDGAARPTVVATVENGRPVTRKDPVPKTNGVSVKQANGNPGRQKTTVATAQLLQYGDGSMVDGKNLTEVQTFQRYLADKEATPKSKVVLLAYYQEQAQNPPVSSK
jgi:hypothetical protein